MHVEQMTDEGRLYLHISINQDKCTRCYTCIECCTTDALQLDKGHFIHDTTLCAYCEVCQDVCPEQAFQIRED